MEYIEVSAESVESAITKACVDLGITSDKIEYQVISEGSAGFLGFGKKPAVIKVWKKEDLEAEKKAIKKAEKEAAKALEKSSLKETKKEEKKTEKSAVKEEKKENKGQKKNEKRQKNNQQSAPKQKKEEPAEVKKPVKERKIPVKTEEEIRQMKEAADAFLKGTFAAMGIESEISMSYDTEEGCLNADISGDDMGVLIGKRGQTLDSLQYLTSLVINKDNKDEYVRVKLDTEDYRRRRKDTLENLAKNIASKVKKTGKTVVLEPMNPYERRIIHSTLQSNKNVETFSEGNEPYRHVVVKPVRNRK